MLTILVPRTRLRCAAHNYAVAIPRFLSHHAITPKERRRMEPRRGLEPLWDFSRCPLKAVCLPISPPRQYEFHTEKCIIFKRPYQTLVWGKFKILVKK